MVTFLRATNQFISFEGDDAAAEAKAKADAEAAAAAAAAAAAGDDDKQFTQEQVNTFLAEERRKMQEKQRITVAELETLKKSKSLSVKEKESLEKRIDDLQTQYMTVEEKARRNEEAAEKKRSEEVTVLTKERDNWKTKHARLVVNTAIINAAAEAKAYEHEQIIALIAPKTKLVEILDDEGKPTGDYEPKVSFPDKNKDDEPIVLELTIVETVKRMKELEKFGNLFEGTKKGGLGGTGSQTTGGKVDLAKIAKEDPTAYRKLRKERIASE